MNNENKNTNPINEVDKTTDKFISNGEKFVNQSFIYLIGVLVVLFGTLAIKVIYQLLTKDTLSTVVCIGIYFVLFVIALIMYWINQLKSVEREFQAKKYRDRRVKNALGFMKITKKKGSEKWELNGKIFIAGETHDTSDNQ